MPAGGTAPCSSLRAWPLLSSSLGQPSLGIPMRGMSVCVLFVRQCMERQEREQAAVRGQSWQWAVLLPQIPPPGRQQVMVVPVHGTGAWSHLQASPLPTQHLMSAELFYLVILQGVG